MEQSRSSLCSRSYSGHTEFKCCKCKQVTRKRFKCFKVMCIWFTCIIIASFDFQLSCLSVVSGTFPLGVCYMRYSSVECTSKFDLLGRCPFLVRCISYVWTLSIRYASIYGTLTIDETNIFLYLQLSGLTIIHYFRMWCMIVKCKSVRVFLPELPYIRYNKYISAFINNNFNKIYSTYNDKLHIIIQS